MQIGSSITVILDQGEIPSLHGGYGVKMFRGVAMISLEQYDPNCVDVFGRTNAYTD